MKDIIDIQENDLVCITAKPNPLKTDAHIYKIQEGTSIEELLQQIQPDVELAPYANVWLDEQIVLPGMYNSTFVNKDSRVVVKYSLAGGGDSGKQVMMMVAMVAVMMVASVAAAALAGQVGAAGTGLAAVGGTAGNIGVAYTVGGIGSALAYGATYAATYALIGIVGTMAINALIPMPSTDLASIDSGALKYTLEGASNQMPRFNSLPVVLGKYKVYPDYCATPYTETVGDDNYLRFILNWGYGPLQVDNVRIADTPINDYQEVEHQFAEVYEPSNPFTLYPGSVFQESIQTPVDTKDTPVVRTTGQNVEEVTVEFNFVFGLFHIYSSKMYTGASSRTFKAEYRIAFTEEWLPLPIFNGEDVWTITATTKDAFNKGFTHRFPTPNQYDIRITPLDNGNRDNIGARDIHANGVTWTTLTGLKSSVPVLLDGLCMSAMRIRATDQLNGSITDLSGVVTTICPDWDKTTKTWITRATNNPASLYLYCIKDSKFLNTPMVDSQIDINQIQYWHEYCDVNGFECNLVIKDAIGIEDLLVKIATTGRASPHYTDGKRTVIIDEPKQTKQVVTPRNSWGFMYNKAFMDMPHAWRISFSNEEKDYLTDEYVVYADGYDENNATLYETLTFEGVTKPEQIFKMGRYYHNTIKLRPEGFSFSMDAEGLVCDRGDVMLIHHDVPGVGIKTARINKLIIDEDTNDCNGVVLDDFVLFEEGKKYYIKIRHPEGYLSEHELINQYNPDDIDASAEKYYLTTTTPISLDNIPSVGDLCMVGNYEVDTVKGMVKSISFQNDLSANIELVNYNENVYTLGEIPEFESNITLTPEYYYNTPKGPDVIITSTYSDERAALRNLDGSVSPRIGVNYQTVPIPTNVLISKYEIQWKNSINDFWQNKQEVNANTSTFFVPDVQEDDSIDIRIRSFAQAKNSPGVTGQPGNWTQVTVASVIGTTSVPPDITNIRIENRHITWEYPDKPIDFKGYEVRQLGGTTPVWDLGTVVSNGLITQASFSVDEKTYGTQIYMVKAVDVNDKYSTNYAYVLSDFGPVDVANVKDETEYQDDWLGNGTVVGGTVLSPENVLVSSSSGVFWEGVSSKLFWSGASSSLFWGGSYFDMYYTTNPYTILSDGRMTVQIAVDSIYGYFLEYRRYQEGSTPYEGWNTWTNYLEVKKGQVYQFKVSCYQGTRASVLQSLVVINDVPDQSEFFNDIIIPAEGLRIPIQKQYERIKTVTYALQTDGSGGISILLEDKDPVNGPLIKVLNSNNEQVEALIDVTVYGVPKT